jgi:hypothetical protein
MLGDDCYLYARRRPVLSPVADPTPGRGQEDDVRPELGRERNEVAWPRGNFTAISPENESDDSKIIT